MRSAEISSEPETPSSRFINQTQLCFDELLKHAIWNVGMPYQPPNDTPLRWHLTEYVGEDTPRDIGLWIKLDEQRFITLTKILRKVKPDDGVWKIYVTENFDDSTTNYTRAEISEDREVSERQTKKEQDRGDSGEILAISEYDYSGEQKAQIHPHLTSLLEEACAVMPERQETFMRSLDKRTLELAALMQRLCIHQDTGKDPLD